MPLPEYPIVTGEVGVTNINYPVGNVRRYGATGNGVTEDTLAFQNAANSLRALGSPATATQPLSATGTLFIPMSSKPYILKRVFVYPGMTIEADAGVVCKRPANAGSGSDARMFEVYSAASPGESAPVTFRSLILDGSRTAQGPYTIVSHEQTHLIYITGPEDQSGLTARVRAVVENVVVREVLADGVAVGSNVDVELRGIFAFNCLRGGITQFGHNSRMRVAGFRGWGDVHPSALHIEPDYPGTGGLPIVTEIVNAEIRGETNVIGTPGSFITLTNVQTGGPTRFAFPGATLLATNCRFEMGHHDAAGSNNRIAFPHRVTFSNCEFVATRAGAPAGIQRLNALTVQWSTATGAGDRLRLVGCRFSVGADAGASDVTCAVYHEIDLTARGNLLEMDDCVIAPQFKQGVYGEQGGNYRLVNVVNHAVLPYRWASEPGQSDIRMLMEGGEVGGSATQFCHIHHSTAGSVFEFRNVTLDESLNVITTAISFKANTYRGQRVIFGAAAPPETAHGLLNDVWRLKTPVAGQPYEWVCTASGRPGEGVATWKVLSTVAA